MSGFVLKNRPPYERKKGDKLMECPRNGLIDYHDPIKRWDTLSKNKNRSMDYFMVKSFKMFIKNDIHYLTVK